MPDSPDTFTLSVHVSGLTGSLQGVRVTAGKHSGDTDQSGNAQFALPPGTYTVTATDALYRSDSKTVHLVADSSVELSLSVLLILPYGRPLGRDELMAASDVSDDDKAAALAFWAHHAPRAYSGLLSGNGWTWDADTQSYTSDSGTTVGVNELKRQSLVFTVGVETDELEPYAKAMATGKTPVGDWQRQASKTIKALYVAQALLAAGGSLAAEDVKAVRGSVASKTGLRYAMDRLSRFGEQVAGAKGDNCPSVDATVARGGLYADGGNIVNETVKANSHRRAVDRQGRKLFLFERNRLDPGSEHCVTSDDAPGCIEETARGWQEIGTLSPLGQRTCGWRDRCWLEYALVPSGTKV